MARKPPAPDDQSRVPGFSRRNFLKTAGVGAANIGAGAIGQAPNDAGTFVNVAGVRAILMNATAGAERGALRFATRTAGAAMVDRWQVTGVGDLLPIADATSISFATPR